MPVWGLLDNRNGSKFTVVWQQHDGGTEVDVSSMMVVWWWSRRVSADVLCFLFGSRRFVPKAPRIGSMPFVHRGPTAASAGKPSRPAMEG